MGWDDQKNLCMDWALENTKELLLILIVVIIACNVFVSFKNLTGLRGFWNIYRENNMVTGIGVIISPKLKLNNKANRNIAEIRLVKGCWLLKLVSGMLEWVYISSGELLMTWKQFVKPVLWWGCVCHRNQQMLSSNAFFAECYWHWVVHIQIYYTFTPTFV